jgi:cleavage and polyadenylation specificity factor subunit 2
MVAPPALAVLPGKGSGFTITPYSAGHMVGGAMWRVSLDEEDIVYAVDYNHKRERHLNASVLEAAFSRPAVLITGLCVYPSV